LRDGTMLLGTGITSKSDLPGNPILQVEYHQCDKCGVEFKLYFRHASPDMDKALEAIARKLGNNGHEDLCFGCQNPQPAEQLVMPFVLK